MSGLKIGDIAPDFNLDSTDGELSLKNFKGKNIVLYFYPKDMTPGCTVQAKDFSSLNQEFQKLDTQIIGVSKDNLSSHLKFIDQENIPYPLLVDTEAHICKLYDILKEKNMFGKTYMGINRTTFLIGKNTKILKIWCNVKLNGHAQKVLDTVKTLDTTGLLDLAAMD